MNTPAGVAEGEAVPKLDTFHKLTLAGAVLAVGVAVVDGAVLGQVMDAPCSVAGPSVRLGLLAGWLMLALLSAAACWWLLRLAAGPAAALAAGLSRRANRRPVPASASAPPQIRAAPTLATSAAVLRFPSAARRRAAVAAPRPAGTGSQVVRLRLARFAPWRRRRAPHKPALEHECRGEC